MTNGIMNHEVYLVKDNYLVENKLWVISKAILIQEGEFTKFVIFDDDLKYNFTKIFNNNMIVMINSYPLKNS